MSNGLYELPENCDFSLVQNASSEEYDCSPKLKDKFFSEFSGILINGPKEVSWPKNASLEDYPVGPWGTTEGPLRLMVAGLVRAEYKAFGLKGDTSEEVLMVAVNQETAQTYSGKMPRAGVDEAPDFVTNAPERNRSEEELNSLISNHFNFDLVHDLGLPIIEASYNVYATLGDMKSNVIVIKTKVE